MLVGLVRFDMRIPGCGSLKEKLLGKGKCRFLTSKGRLDGKRSCRRPILLLAKGKTKWHFSHKARLPRGKYHAVVRAYDRAGNKERPAKRNTVKFNVR